MSGSKNKKTPWQPVTDVGHQTQITDEPHILVTQQGVGGVTVLTAPAHVDTMGFVLFVKNVQKQLTPGIESNLSFLDPSL
jgi:hypothetical protein